MKTRDDLDGRLSAWFAADAAAEPEHLLGQVLARTARTRRRPAWRIPERWIPMTAVTSPWVPGSPVTRRVLAVALLVLALVAGALYIVGTQLNRSLPLTGPAGNGRIAYISNGQLFTARADRSDATRIDTDSRVKGIPTWSRDGTRQAFLAYKTPTSTEFASLIVTGRDGSNPVTIVSDAQSLGFYSFSPDGKTMAFSKWITYQGQRDRIFLAPTDGSAAPVQIGDPDLSAWNPAFSPDGTRIAFASDHCQPGATGSCGFGLHVMSASGADVRELTARCPGSRATHLVAGLGGSNGVLIAGRFCSSWPRARAPQPRARCASSSPTAARRTARSRTALATSTVQAGPQRAIE